MYYRETKKFTVILIALFVILASAIPVKRSCAELQENPVLAEVGDVKITLNDLKEAAQGTSPRGYSGLSLDEKKRLLDNMIAYKLLYFEAKKKKLDENPEVIKAVEDAKRDIMSRYLAKLEVLPKVQVSDKEIQEYYDKNQASFNPRRATITHFHILKENESGETKPEEAKKFADRIKERLDKGESFEDIFSSVQEDKDWGESLSKPSTDTVIEGKFFVGSPFDSVVFNLKKNETGIIDLPDRFMIVRLDDLVIPEPPPLKHVRDAIEGNLKQKRWEAAFNEYIDGLKKNFSVRKNEDLIQ